MRQAASIRIRPHILLCAVCQYGGGTRPPLDADNLPECLEYVMERPQTPMTLVPGADWMMCAPCKRRTAAGACVNVCGHGGLENELRDLIVLQILGLSYGATLAAGDLFALMFERIPVTTPVCSRAHVKTSIWWDTCAERPEGSAAYVKGREELMRQGFGVRRP
jgi:hypothetical protein